MCSVEILYMIVLVVKTVAGILFIGTIFFYAKCI